MSIAKHLGVNHVFIKANYLVVYYDNKNRQVTLRS